MQIKLWGVRGSLPAPINNKEYNSKLFRILDLSLKSNLSKTKDINGFIESLPDELRYIMGGDTTCITVLSNSGNLYIIDCGTGIRRLGNELMEGDCGKGKGNLNIMITHNHWDHIQGLPFFKPLYIAGNRLNFYSPFKNQQDFLENQMKKPHFPVTFEGTASTKKYHYINPSIQEKIQLEEDLFISIYPLKHPQECYAFKFEQNGKIFIFATDTEFSGETFEKMDNSNKFFKNADILILDSQYTLDEAFVKIDWGHTSYTMAVNCALNWNVKTMIMTHHEPSYSDDVLQKNYSLALQHSKMMKNETTEILLAREGMVFEL